MSASPPRESLRRVGLAPLVRPTRNQAEVELLPPYGDPEVTLAGELGTYLVVGALAALAYRKLRR
ncbi:MAG: hypothetical protein U5J98_02445 [Halobacteriales archaeon]|nr:hypothetical protein [Halobacteriales archaeon]